MPNIPTPSMIWRCLGKILNETLGKFFLASLSIGSISPSPDLFGVHAYWSFQTDQAGGTYSNNITINTFPDGVPSFSTTGSSFTNLNNFGSTFTASDSTVWQPGKAVAWNGKNGSNGNSFQVEINATRLKDFSIRFKFRNNGTMSSGTLVQAFSSFEYDVGNGFVPVPAATLNLPNNQGWNNQWTMDLSSLSEIEATENLTLKWSLPNFESTTENTQLRIDDLEITASVIPPLTNSTVIEITKTSNAQPNGYTYPVAIEVPTGISTPMPVAIVLHGRGGTGQGSINQFRNTLDNHILVAPSGYLKCWNITEEPSDLPDIEFLGELITQIKTYPNVDATKIRIVGTSNGAGMANRVFVEIDDPGIDIICPIVSQLHTGNYRNGNFYYPSNEQNTGAAFGESKGYDTPKNPATGRRILAITNTDDGTIPYTGGPKFGSDFLHSQDAAYAMAISQGFTGSQLSNDAGVELYSGIVKYSYLNDQVVHIKGSAGHTLDNNLKTILREFFDRPPPPATPTSLIASATGTEQINLQWNDNSEDETGFVIQKSASGNSGWSVFKTLPANTVIASDIAVDKGETWHYRVKATRADGDSSWSTMKSATVLRSRQLALSNYNVLFINIDDLKPMIGSFGDTTIKTPKMDQLSATSLNFTNAHCQQAICTASRASYLTGLRPDSTRVWDLRTHLRDVIPDVVTIPQHFKESGYNSHGIGKIFHGTTIAMQDGERSFDSWEKGSSTYRYHEPSHAALEDNKNSPLPATDKGEFLRDGVTPVGDSDYSAGVIAELANSKLAQFKNDYENNSKPFFLGVGFYKPHLPFTAPKKYWDLYDPETDIDLTGYDGTKNMPTGVNEFAAPYGGEQSGYSDIDEPPSAAQARRLTHAYMACVSYVDQQVGKIIDELDRLGLAESTIIVLFGDHGFHLADHGAFWAKHSNFDNATRTPLIIRVPGMQKTGNYHTPVGLVDVFPTLVDLCSLPYPKQPNGLHLEGTSLLPLIEDPSQPWKKGVFSQYQRRIWKKNSAGDTVDIANPGNGIGYSIRTERYRYTEWWRTETTNQDSKGNYTDRDVKLFNSPEMIELYDYDNDPKETTNLVNDPNYSLVVSELSAALAGGDGWSTVAAAPPALTSYALTINSGNGGSVNAGGNFEHGTNASIIATPDPGYSFAGWTGNGILDSNLSNTIVNMREDRTVNASFTIQQFPLVLSAGPGGTVDGSGSYSYGANATIQATPTTGYVFNGWSGVGITNPNSATTTISMTESREASATFILDQLELSIISGSGGNVSGEGSYAYGSSPTITAIPKDGFSFVRWEGEGITDGSQPITTVEMTKDRLITAFFSEESYRLNLSSGLGGSVQGEGTFPHGSNAPIEAVANTGFTFSGWTGDGVVDANRSITTALMTEARSLTASFTQNIYSLSFASSTGGSLLGEGSFAHGSNAEITAVPDEGYSFNGWMGEGISDLNLSTTTVTMTTNRTVSATFIQNNYELQLSAGHGGSVSGSGSYSHGETAQIAATALDGYTFVEWTGTGIADSNLSSTSVFMDGARSLSATFTIKKYRLEVLADTTDGNTSGSGMYDHGSWVPINAIPANGFVFNQWRGENISEANSSSTTLLITNDQNITAHFSPKAIEKNILSISSSPTFSGTTTGSGSYDHPKVVSIRAHPMDGFSFVEWIGEGITDSYSSSTQIILQQDLNITALFSLNSHKLDLETEGGGSLEGTGTYSHGSEVEIIATPEEGYSFTKWVGTGVKNPLAQKTFIQVDQNQSLQAIFTRKNFSLVLNAGTGGIVKGSGTFPYGSSVNIEAIPNSGFKFTAWQGNGIQNPYSASTSLEITEFLDLNASFEKLKVTNLPDTSYVEADWYQSTWLGFFYQSDSDWLYHQDLGWVFPNKESENFIWLWSPQLEWLWLEKTSFPHSFAWSLSENDWIFFHFKSTPPSSFHYNEEVWKTFEKDRELDVLESLF